MQSFDIAVIGGGAAGFFGALAAAEARPGARIIILERGTHPLAKVKISGGGRCNVTHACFDPAELVAYYPRGAQELRGPFTRFGPGGTAAWFEARGVALKTEADGRMFPVTDDSQTVMDCLMGEAARLGVQVQSRCAVQALEKAGEGFVLRGAGFEPLTAGKVLLAAGGNSTGAYALAAGLGHTMIPPVPSLFTFNLADTRLAGLAGISVALSELTLLGETAHRGDTAHRGASPLRASGPLLVTHWGLSGPAVLRLSAWGARTLAGSGYHARLRVNWVPGHAAETILAALLTEKSASPKAHAARRDPLGLLPQRLWRSLALAAGVADAQAWGDTPNRALRRLAEELTSGEFEITGKGVFKEEFVTCGGVSLCEVNFRTMESRVCAGLYLAGEILDIDGLTGGFNFQSAWTTGWIAGRAIGGN